MKNTKRTAAILLFISLFFIGCYKADDLRANLQKTIIEDSWKLHFFDASGDGSARYTPYTFTFHTGGTISVSANGNTFAGQWKLLPSKSGMEISFSGTPAELTELGGAWKITLVDGNKLELRNGGVLLRLTRS